MKVEIRITRASRRSSTGPRAVHWQIALSATKEGQTPYAGFVGAWQKSPDNFRIELPIVPNDLPAWLPADIVCERVHWYILTQLSDAIEQPDGTLSDALTVEPAIVEDFEVFSEAWNHLGMRQLTPAE